MCYTYGTAQLMCRITYKATVNLKSTHNLSMSNVTLRSIAIGIVANNIATTIRMDCYLTGVSTHN